ncbi:MAG: PIN domain-containing protein [Anaerolineaceae bacterium]
MRIYLDACCINRPFDDQSQSRIRLESEAVIFILERLKNSDWVWVSSEVLFTEIEETPDEERRARALLLAAEAQENIELTMEDLLRAKRLEQLGFNGMDALHIACAERSACEIFLTTDDRLLQTAAKNKNELTTRVMNPLKWLEEATE